MASLSVQNLLKSLCNFYFSSIKKIDSNIAFQKGWDLIHADKFLMIVDTKKQDSHFTQIREWEKIKASTLIKNLADNKDNFVWDKINVDADI